MFPISIPDIRAISKVNQDYVAYFEKRLGQIPNLYMAMMHSENAFNTFYTFQVRTTSLSLREREAISLVIAQVNGSLYCLSAHTMIARLNGFSDDEIIELRSGKVSFDLKLHALVQLVKGMVENKGRNLAFELNSFFALGYTQLNFMDVLQAMGENLISNLIAKTLGVAVDFPLAEELF